MKTRTLATVLALALAACGGGDSSEAVPAADSASAAADTASATGGMAGMQDDGSMALQSHMQAMRGASGDSLRAMLPAHRQMAANLLARMNREMAQMNMQADAAWTAAVDSVRQDLTRMPEMDASELKAALPGHEARLSRLTEMHRTMMGGMKM